MTAENEDYDVEQYSQTERDVLAHMLMRSLRGSWTLHKPRAQMLKQLAEAGLTDYDGEKVHTRADDFLRAEHPDGRTFRYIYENGPSFPEQTEEKVVRRLVGELPPGDLNFDRRAISRYYDDDDTPDYSDNRS